MTKTTHLSQAVLITAAILIAGCSSLSLRKKSGATPLWVKNHPVSRTHFVGIGSAKIEEDLYAAQKLARNRALQDISEQIQVSIVTDVSTSANCKTINNRLVVNESHRERIAAFSNAVLADWEEKSTFHCTNGFFWSKVVLSKKEYYRRVNKKVDNATGRLSDIIRNGKQGTAQFRIHQLYKGFEIIDEFFGTPLYGRIGGRQVLLNNELERCMSRLLECIEIRPTIYQLALSSKESAPRVLGVYIFLEGEVDRSLSVAWSASKDNVSLKALPVRKDGLHPVLITSLPASSGSVTISATPKLGNLTYDLIRRKFNLPSGSFTVNREKARVFIDNRDGFNWSLAEKLEEISAITIVYSRKEAQFILKSDFTKGSDTALEKSIHTAGGNLSITLCTNSGDAVLNYNRKIRAADGISSTRALENTQKYALDVAVKEVERIF